MASGSKRKMSAARPTASRPRSCSPRMAAGMAVMRRTASSRRHTRSARHQVARKWVDHSWPSSRSRWAPPSETPTIICGCSCTSFSSSRHAGVSFDQWKTVPRSSDRARSNSTSAGWRAVSVATTPTLRPTSARPSGEELLDTRRLSQKGGGSVDPFAGSRFGWSIASRSRARCSGSLSSRRLVAGSAAISSFQSGTPSYREVPPSTVNGPLRGRVIKSE
jgi:hypothetical protein